MPYIQHHFNPQILIVTRHPASIIASHIRVDNPDIKRIFFERERLINDFLDPFIQKVRKLDHPLKLAGAKVGAIYFVLNKQLKNNTDWLVVKHEQLCQNPMAEFQSLFDKLDLNWTNSAVNKIYELNKEGEGYTNKRKAHNQVDKWKRELDEAQIDHIRTGFSIFQPDFYESFWRRQ